MTSIGASRRDWLRWLGAAGAAAGLAGLPLRAAATPLERVRERGALTVGIYHDMPPFHVGGKGIDVELAQALAESLGVRLSLLPFHADENMADDLRNMVWRGHYLGYGPADVLLHVPVDRPLMDANPQVSIVALSGLNTEVVLTIGWEISWYQYRVSFDAAQPVRLAEKGFDPDELDPSFLEWNADLTEDGRIVPDVVRT